MPLSGSITLALAFKETKVFDLNPAAEVPLAYTKVIQLLTGTGADQADMIFHDQRTLAASANEDLDLAGSLAGAFGNTLTFVKLKGLFVIAAGGNTNNVNVTRPATNGVPLFLAAGDGLPVRPGGMFSWVARDATAVTVTAATGDLINFANSGAGTSVTYDVVIVGASA